MTLIVGFSIVDFKGDGGWVWVITLFGYLTVLKGLLLLAVPEKSVGLSLFVMEKTKVLRLLAATTLLLGIVFLFLGLGY